MLWRDKKLSTNLWPMEKRVLDWRQIFESFAKSLAGENDKNPIFFGVERIKTENLHQHYTTSTALVPGHHEPKSFKNINQKGDDFRIHPDKENKEPSHTKEGGGNVGQNVALCAEISPYLHHVLDHVPM